METNDILQWVITGGFGVIATIFGKFLVKAKKKLAKIGRLALESGEALIKTDMVIKNFNKRNEDGVLDAEEAKSTIDDIKDLIEDYKDIPKAVKELIAKE